ncbi:GNAT family N-acetyltransferase [Ancylobacter tetraedralis]|nr:GNAT family protein [Ancylobacter tetraedralis]
MRTVLDDPRVTVFVGEQLRVLFWPPFRSLGIERRGSITAGVVFNHFEGVDCHASVVGSGFTRAFLADVGDFAFRGMGRRRITVKTEQPRIVRIAERLGGRIEGCLRDHFGEGRDAFLVGILRHEYRF